MVKKAQAQEYIVEKEKNRVVTPYSKSQEEEALQVTN